MHVMEPPRTLLTIPVELQREIFDLLEYPTLQVLCATHPHFRAVVDLDHLRASKPPAYFLGQLIIAAASDPFFAPRELFACKDCLRLRPGIKFDDWIRSKREITRYCIDCGLLSRYHPGTRIDALGVPGLLCRNCKVFKQGEAEVRPGDEVVCWSCFGVVRRKKELEMGPIERSIRRWMKAMPGSYLDASEGEDEIGVP